MVNDDLKSIGHSGAAGRGSKATSPSSAARSLAGGTKPAAKKAPVKKAPAKKAPAKKALDEGTAAKVPVKKAVAKKPVAKKSPAKTTAAKQAVPAKKTPAKKSAQKKAVAQAEATTDLTPPATPSSTQPADASAKPAGKSSGRRSHLRAVPDQGASANAQPAENSETQSAANETKESASAKNTSKPKKTEAPEQPALSLEDIVKAVLEGAQRVLGADWERQLATIVASMRRRMSGDYQIDEFGLDTEILEILNAAVGPVAEKWFRLEVRGIENIPTDGGALLVANHSGTVPVDGLITGYAVSKYTGRTMRALGADLVFKLPIVGEVARKSGATLACAQDAERLLTTGELAAVWPEGFKGVGKPFSERYKLQRFGRGGFVSSAMRAQVPIIPVSIVGAEEIYPLVGNIPSLARLFGLPYIPITPFFPLLGPLGLIPLPSKWIIEFGEPIRTDAYAPESADDPMLLFNVTDQVRENIQQTLYRLLVERGNPFS